MAKQKKAKARDNGLTRKQIVRRRQARRQNRYLLIGLGAVAVIVVGLLVTALVQEFAIEPRSPVALVNGVKIRTNDFQKRVLFEWDNVQRQLSQWLQLQAQYGSDDEGGAGLFEQQIAQLRSQLENPDTLSLQVLERMIDEELIRQKAVEEGLQVTEAELQEEIERQFGYVRNPTPTPVVTPAVISSTEVVTGSDGITTTQVTTATATPQPTVQLMTEPEFQQSYASAMQRLSESYRFAEADFRRLIEASLLEQKVREKIGEQVPTTEEQVWARHILIIADAEAEDQEAAQQEAEERAQEAFNRLQAGEDFAALALELSDDPGSKEEGGDLGWFGRGRMQMEFETVAFSLPVGEISEPFTTTFGYHHILEVLEKDPARELDEFTLDQRRSQAFDDWLQEQQQTANIERFWAEDKVPPTPTPPRLPQQ
ncbi:MAG: peptidylprolyl isomerase [Chloroflexi bacterium]|nr:peptidylprolyl isomerase [Chloroflexota bacterium]